MTGRGRWGFPQGQVGYSYWLLLRQRVEARTASRIGVALMALSLTACGANGSREPSIGRESVPAPDHATAAVATTKPPTATLGGDSRPLLVVLGDSLTAGLGLQQQEAYPALLQQRLDTAGLALRVVNAGVSGDTSAGGLSRLGWVLEGDVRLLIVALGGNDALRALPIDELRRNLSQIVTRAKARDIPIILAGMEAPPNLGRDYTIAFRSVYPSLAKEHGLTLLPFLLDGVAGVEHLNQRDGIHPTDAGARVIADRLWPLVEPIARSAVTRPRGGATRG